MTNFPTSLDNEASLYGAVNFLQTTLDGSLQADANGNNGSATDITVADTTNFPTAGLILVMELDANGDPVNPEVISYTGKTPTKFTGITRGADGTVTKAHDDGVNVKNGVCAGYHENLKDAIIAMQTVMGLYPRAYGQAYRTAGFAITNNNTWYTMGWSGGTNNLKNIALGNFNSANGDDTDNKLTVTYAGVYKITYHVVGYLAGASTAITTRLFRNDTVGGVTDEEILGSYTESLTAAAAYRNTISKTVIKSLAAGDFISIQVGASGAGSQITTANDANMPDPTTTIVANIVIEKIDGV